METATDAYLNRWKAREKFVGEDGGIYHLRRLKPSEIFRVRDMLQNVDGSTFNVLAGLAGITTVEFNGERLEYTFPKARQDLDKMLDRVGMEGLPELAKAFGRLNADEQPAPEAEAEADAA